MERVDRITLTFEDNGRLHGDLVLRIGEGEWRCDSYFLWCEEPESDADYVAIIRRVLGRLIGQWIGAIRLLKEGGICFLPFDFSDQSTGWLRCVLDGSDLVIERGWSMVEGWSVAPSDVGEFLANVPDFNAVGSAVLIGRDMMLRSLLGGSGEIE